MDDLISRQALCQYALNQKDKSVTPNDIMRFQSADRPKGMWVFDTQIPIGKGAYSAGYRCSICEKDYFRVEGMNFCPNCGAKMVREDGE